MDDIEKTEQQNLLKSQQDLVPADKNLAELVGLLEAGFPEMPPRMMEMVIKRMRAKKIAFEAAKERILRAIDEFDGYKYPTVAFILGKRKDYDAEYEHDTTGYKIV